MNDAVRYELDGHVATITYNRPEALNAVNADMRRGLNDAFSRFRDDEAAWVAIVTGAGRAFCAGGDLRDGAGSIGEFEGTFWEKPTINSFESGWEIFKPVIAAVNGYCLGYGLTLVTWCDFVDRQRPGRVRFPRGADRRAHDRRRHPAASTGELAVRDGAAAHGRAHRRGAGQGDRARGVGRAARRPDGRGARVGGATRPCGAVGGRARSRRWRCARSTCRAWRRSASARRCGSSPTRSSRRPTRPARPRRGARPTARTDLPRRVVPVEQRAEPGNQRCRRRLR